jgi:hypothetical protein
MINTMNIRGGTADEMGGMVAPPDGSDHASIGIIHHAIQILGSSWGRTRPAGAEGAGYR